jgi:glutamine synthetase
MYTQGHTLEGIRRLPANLLDALRAFAADEVLRARLGASFGDSYLKLKQDEWARFARHLTEWERETTLDC